MSQFTVTQQHVDALNSFIEKYGESISHALGIKQHTAKASGQTYRVINHWSKIGLLDEDRESDGKWRKFSVVDLILLKIYEELRGYGFSIEKLKKVRDSITYLEGKRYPFIEFAYCVCVTKAPVFLVVDKDGFAAFLTDEDITLSEHQYGYQNYLKILLNDLLTSVFPQPDFTPKLNPPVLLSEAERRVLIAVRKQNVNEITIKMKDGKISTIDKKTLYEGVLTKNVDFGTIIIKKASGRTVSSEILEKEKL